MKRLLSLSVFVIAYLSVYATEVTYRIVSYNADAQDFVIEGCGEKPAGSIVYFNSKFGATTGNRYNQLPRNNEAQLLLYGWEGCRINSITFSMCSNIKSGTIGFSVIDGEETVYKMNPVDFADEAWFGHWVTKDLGVYVDITKDLNLEPLQSDNWTINLKAGTPEGSVYINAFTINYDAPEDMTLESPLGWVFEKLEKKSTLNEGDVLMLYRSGDAAADIDGMETSHYLDAIGINSTANVTEPDVELFTVAHDESGSHWTLTDQYGRQLGAKAAQSLAWDEGVCTWDITLGYDGATIASTNTKYGTLRYNAPSGSYPRFWNYTSKTLSLPYAYRRVRQIEPTISKSLTLAYEEITVELGTQDTLTLKAVLAPTTTTDKRINWTSSCPEVASVKSGIVTLLAPGETIITASAHDGGSTTEMRLVVTSSKVPGDANGDGNVTMSDANLITNYYVTEGDVELNKDLADINSDNIITMADANSVVNIFVSQE